MDNGESRTRSRVRTIVRVVLFTLLAALLFVYLNMAVMLKGSAQTKGAVDAFYALNKDTVDVMYIGTSATSRYYVNPIGYRDYGLAVYSFGMNWSPTYMVDDLMREALATQDPDLFIVELRPSCTDPSSVDDSKVRKTLDSVSLFSPNRVSMAVEAYRYVGGDNLGLADFLFPISKYHSRVIKGELTKDDLLLKTPVNKTQGFHLSKLTVSQVPQDAGSFTDARGEIPARSAESLANLLDYCDALGKDVLFVISPFSVSSEMAESLNASAAYVEKRGYPVLNCNNERVCADMGIDWSTDFYNSRHVNYLGAEKFTAYLSKYVREHYDLPDRRGDASYSAWNSGVETYEKYVRKGIKYHESGDEGEE